jgi:predicted NAD/FAD-dependent oxidoreductase
MRDALFGKGCAGWAASSLLLPCDDLGALFPGSAVQWLHHRHGARTRVLLNRRVRGLERTANGWRLLGDGWVEDCDRVVWATAARPAAMTMGAAAEALRAQGSTPDANTMAAWALTAGALSFTAITTVYAQAPGVRLGAPMLALRALPGSPGTSAQFVFDRGQLRPTDASAQGVLAFVVSASEGERGCLQERVLQQGREQLGLQDLRAVQTVVEKRATFACTPGLVRPPAAIASGLWAAGDYVQGPYPATLEAAVRSGLVAARAACC